MKATEEKKRKCLNSEPCDNLKEKKKTSKGSILRTFFCMLNSSENSVSSGLWLVSFWMFWFFTQYHRPPPLVTCMSLRLRRSGSLSLSSPLWVDNERNASIRAARPYSSNNGAHALPLLPAQLSVCMALFSPPTAPHVDTLRLFVPCISAHLPLSWHCDSLASCSFTHKTAIAGISHHHHLLRTLRVQQRTYITYSAIYLVYVDFSYACACFCIFCLVSWKFHFFICVARLMSEKLYHAYVFRTHGLF